MKTNKNKYRELCSQEESIPIFSKDWWLDSTAGFNGWSVALVEENGVIVASMPYIIKKKWGMTIISHPPLTQTLGPWLRPIKSKYSRKLGTEKKRIQALFKQLPKFDYFHQNWSHELINWLPVYWLGYVQTTKYTYVIPDISNLELVLESFESSYRNKIKNAGKSLLIKENLSIEKFYEINSLTFQRQKLKNPYSFDQIKRHDNILKSKHCRKIFYAEDEKGQVHSALYLTWDVKRAYVHMVGEDPELRNSGAGVALIWHAIKYSSNILKVKEFDFEGSMLENIEQVRRDSGGIQRAYFSINKTPSLLIKIFMLAIDFIKNKNN